MSALGGSASRGVSAPGVSAPGGCLLLERVSGPEGVWSRGDVPGGDPPGWPLLWAVCILLECILV